MRGRKPLYRPDKLKIGEKMPFPVDKVEYIDQYLSGWRKRYGMKFSKHREKGNLVVLRDE